MFSAFESVRHIIILDDLKLLLPLVQRLNSSSKRCHSPTGIQAIRAFWAMDVSRKLMVQGRSASPGDPIVPHLVAESKFWSAIKKPQGLGYHIKNPSNASKHFHEALKAKIIAFSKFEHIWIPSLLHIHRISAFILSVFFSLFSHLKNHLVSSVIPFGGPRLP